MDGIHDMGGMVGFGPIIIEADEAVFHAPWEGRVLAINLVSTTFLPGNTDNTRHSMEKVPPADYLRISYYERWFEGVVSRCRVNGVLSDDQVDQLNQGTAPDLGATSDKPPVPAELVLAFLQAGAPASREIEAAPAFKVGDQVHTKNLRVEGHTRLPRYARDKVGTVIAHHGAHVFPDSNAKFEGENPAHLYSVRFAARTLWGATAHPKDTVTLDLWEPYLERA